MSFHGAAAWEYNTVSKLNAKGFFYRGGPDLPPKFINNQFGLTIGRTDQEEQAVLLRGLGADDEAAEPLRHLHGSVPDLKMRDGRLHLHDRQDLRSGDRYGDRYRSYPVSRITSSRSSRQSFAATDSWRLSFLNRIPERPTPRPPTTSASDRYFFNRDNIDIKDQLQPER